MPNPWSNQAVNLIILAALTGGFSGFFAYSPTPGKGNLILSIAAGPGTDDFGNPYVGGLASYSQNETPQIISQIYDGTLAFSFGPSPTVPAFVQGGKAVLALSSGSTNDATDQLAQVTLLSQVESGVGNAVMRLTDTNLDMNSGSITNVNEITANELVLNGQVIRVPQGSPPSISGAGTSYNQGTANTWVTAINYLLALVVDAGLAA
jgi:hypothetical protein